MAKRISVVLSQGQSNHPAKRDLEENLVATLLMERGIDVIVIPHLYDLAADGTGVLALQGLSGHIVLLSWFYERAARWTLDRHGVRGKIGLTTIKPPSDEEEEEGDDEDDKDTEGNGASSKPRVWDARPVPDRKIYCLDLRVHESMEPYLAEIRRIIQENQLELVDLLGWIGGTPTESHLVRYQNPVIPAAPATPHMPHAPHASPGPDAPAAAAFTRIEDSGDRRWYPVIDYTRCTNCMECIDFCLFGVYGVDRAETILVEQPDNCRKGCPACSRVCPENAIIFPQHKTPAIAGADVALGGLKIDLSRLFGAPDGTADAAALAARERDEQLMLAGRAAIGSHALGADPSVASAISAQGAPAAPAHQSSHATSHATPQQSPHVASTTVPSISPGASSLDKDELDNLIDALDEMNL